MAGLRNTSNDLCYAGSCLVESFTGFVFVFFLFFKWIKKFGMWIFFVVDERLVYCWTKRFVLIWFVLFSIIIKTKELFCYGAWQYSSCCNIGRCLYNSSLGHMGFLCSPKFRVLDAGSCCKFLSSFQQLHDEGMSHEIKYLNK